MADKKITQLTELAARPDYNIDVIPIVDSGSATSATKKISRHNYIPELNVTTGSATASKALVLDENSDIKDLRTISASVTSTASFGRFMAAGNSNFSGNITIGGNLNIGDANTDYVVVQADLSSSLRPNNDNAFDVGSTALSWKNVYFKSNISGSSATTASFGALTSPGGVLSTLIPAVSDGAALGTTSKMWSDLFLASGGVINFNNGGITFTETSDVMVVTGGNTRVDRLEIDSANDYLDVSTDLQVISAADITLNPGGNNVKPGGDSQDDLGVDGTAWRKLFVDDIDLNGQGRIDLDADADTSVRSSADDVITFEAGAADIAQMTSTMAISGSSASTGSFGYLNVDGDTVIGGNITLGDAATDAISISADLTSHLIPNTDNTYDLGSAAQSWRQVYAIGNVSSSATSTGSFGNLYVDDDALIKDRVYFNDFGGEYISGDGTDLNLTSGADINIPADIGLTFGNDGEIIEGNGTDLTIKGGDINITAESDVNIPSGIGLTFGNDGEKIEGNGTKLDIAASEIDFTVEATGDINIGSNIGLTFGDDGEKIEGNGTRMSIASGTGMVLDCEGDIEINADGGNVDIKDDTAVLLNISATKVSGSATSTGSFGELKVTGNVGIEGVTSDTILDIDSNSVSHIVHIAGNGATQFSGSVDVTGSMNATTLQQGGVAIGTAISGSLGLVAGVDTGTTVISGSATSTASFAALTVADGVTATLSPISSDAAALGSTSNQWSDLFLADAGVINWDNGDMTLTNASNEIQVDGGDLVIEGTNKVGFGGAPSTDYIQKSTDLKIVAAADVEINAGGSNVKPSADDGAALGLSGTAFSDLFLASGGVVNWNEGDMTLTHSSNAITVGGGKLVVTGNLEVTGTTTTLQSTNLVISDQYAFLASGSSAANVDAGILVQSGSTAGSGSAIFHDTSAQRWAVAKSVAEGDTNALTSTGLVVTTTSGTSVPVGSTPEYGVGELYIDTDDGNEGGFWIYT